VVRARRLVAMSWKRRLVGLGALIIAAYVLFVVAVLVGGLVTDNGNW
jgi:hypothetical protein